ncbi:hypothetical protein D9758_001015 [Tetrapyrgos nigripes]|uniref:PUB domain-containing protein n=1 Tax=Tetrapyrgos nigripes TaxID=182062 RepID=A0A8H5GS59_9AGAR|nr:hypothetical protein D9758_001015 [Tetrapyrgos nigripes]
MSASISDALAAAAERRTQSTSEGPSHAELMVQHEKRQAFRRLIDPGIMRPNAEPQAYKSLETLLKISDNLIREPENPKYQRFKTTNSIIQEQIIKPKGTVEYLRELGFKPTIEDFQPYYSFMPSRMEDLKIGNMILREAFDLQTKKKEQASVTKMTQKEMAQEAADKARDFVAYLVGSSLRLFLQVKLAFMEDRRRKQELEEREKQLREIRAARATASPPPQQTAPSTRTRQRRRSNRDEEDEEDEDVRQMPGTGRVLGATGDEPQPAPAEHNIDDVDEDSSMSGVESTLNIRGSERPPPYEAH